MYAPFFGLQREPFSIAPDPHFLFMSGRHREALAHLLYGLGGGGGFVLLSGEIGAGKTTVCRCFLEQIPADCNAAYIFNPKLTVPELLKSICDEFGIATAGAVTVKDYLDPLNAFLLASHGEGRNNVLIIDEAQQLSAEVLEQLRLLTNLETHERKLLQIILIGQPELRLLLARPELEQLAQRVIARYHLGALSADETAQYIQHRMAVAGLAGALPFDARALQRIHELARGVPRRINLLCDRALLGAFAHGQHRVGRKIVDQAAAEVFGLDTRPVRSAAFKPMLVGVAAAVVALAALGAWVTVDGRKRLASGSASAPATGKAAMATTSSPSATGAVPDAAANTGAARVDAPEKASTRSSAASLAAAPGLQDPATSFTPPLRDAQQAWRELAPAWHLDLGSAESDPCAEAPRQQTQCFTGTTSVALIRQLDRPGILTLRDGQQKPVYVLLTGLGADRATLRRGSAEQTVSLASLGLWWTGEYSTFWRAPASDVKTLTDGRVVVTAAGLASRLSAVPAPVAASGSAADGREPGLKARVFAFQVAQGLHPDGLAGPITFMQLNRAAGIDEPRLQHLN